MSNRISSGSSSTGAASFVVIVHVTRTVGIADVSVLIS